MSSPRLQEIFDEIDKLSQNDEDPDDWIGFLHPETAAEFRHPSNEGRLVGSILYLGGLEVRENELVQRGQIILIDKELVLDDPPDPSEEVA